MRKLALLAILALAVGGSLGCVTKNSTTDGDRQVVDLSRQAVEEAQSDLKAAQAAAPQSSQSWTMIGVGLAKLADAQRGLEHLQVVHGPPLERKKYTQEEMDLAIAKSIKDHEESNVGRILYSVGGVAAGIAGMWFGMPWLSSLFPALAGKWKAAADTGVQIITSLRQKAEEPGGLKAKDLLTIAREYNASAPKGVGDFMEKAATAFEEKLGFRPTVKLPDAQAPVPAAVAA